MKPDFHNPAEGQDPQAREEKLLADLPAFIAFAKEKCEAYRQRLADINPADINSRDALAELPTTEKSSLISEQERCPPFGGYLPDDANPIRQYLSPGPIAEVDDDSHDYWKTASPLFAAGFRRGDLIHNCFSYHFTPAGMMCESGARALGCPVFAGGVGNSEQQARALARFHARGYCGTPDFLGVILDKAEEINADASSLKIASVSGGPLTDAMRKNYNARGIYVLQWFGTAELGCAAFEGAPGGGMVVSEKTLIEIVHPVTKKPLAAGEKGELLITNFNRLYPLIRFATGDLSAVVAGQSPCGRTNMRIAGWLGRSDQSVKVRGMFVHPIQIERIASRFAEIKKAQLIIDSVGGRDEMILHCNLSPQTAAAESLAQKIAEATQAETKLRGEVKFTESIDGEKLIEDKRKG